MWQGSGRVCSGQQPPRVHHIAPLRESLGGTCGVGRVAEVSQVGFGVWGFKGQAGALTDGVLDLLLFMMTDDD